MTALALPTDRWQPMRAGWARIAAVPRSCAHALWSGLGCAQARNALLCILALAAVVGVDQLGRMARALATVGDAQRIAGYALMRQLQAAGIGPGTTTGGAAAPAHAIDPARLGVAGAAPAPAPSAAAAAAPARPAIP